MIDSTRNLRCRIAPELALSTQARARFLGKRIGRMSARDAADSSGHVLPSTSAVSFPCRSRIPVTAVTIAPNTLTCFGADRRGVSLIDLVITVLIMSILSAAAAPRFSSAVSRSMTKSAAQQISADLNYARQYAKQSSQECLVQFTLNPPGYTLVGVPSLDKSGHDYTVNLVDVGYDVSFGTVDFDGQAEVLFNQYGRPLMADGTAALAAGTVTVQAGSNQTTVHINTDSGKAEVP